METYLVKPDDKQLIQDAIEEAEKNTTGEIYVVLAQESSRYFFSACFVWTVIVLLASSLMAVFLHYAWYDIALHYFGFGMLIAFVIGLAYLAFIPALCRLLTPWIIKKHCCHDNAMRQFLAHNVDETKGRTGILLFVSYAEHYAEVIADRNIYHVVEQDKWQHLVDILTQHAKQKDLAQGYILAIQEAGLLLAHHFPASQQTENELPNHFVEI